MINFCNDEIVNISIKKPNSWGEKFCPILYNVWRPSAIGQAKMCIGFIQCVMINFCNDELVNCKKFYKKYNSWGKCPIFVYYNVWRLFVIGQDRLILF